MTESSLDSALSDLNTRVSQIESIVEKLGPAIPSLLAAAEDLKTFDFPDLLTRISALESVGATATTALPDAIAAVNDLQEVVGKIVAWAQGVSGENILVPAANGMKPAA
jgi:ABC-type transporter Mla subunit MlaD